MQPRRIQHPGDFGRVAVLSGGASAEREISLASGRAVLKALWECGVDVHEVDGRPPVLERLQAGKFQRVFVALHGRGGEDGVIQGALETVGLPYTGSGVLGSALAMDKQRTKLIWRAHGIATPPFHMLEARADLRFAAESLGFPLSIKPVHEGSSIGISKVEDPSELYTAWQLARRTDEHVMAERWVHGTEYTAGILGREVLPLIRLEVPRMFYDYEAKYSDDAGTQYILPCGLDQGQEERLQQTAFKAFDAVGGAGWGRVDFLCDATGEPTFIEVNTVPGLTSHSLLPMAARAAGIDFQELVWRILETSVN
jgi:D-alanine-D-alanine ligase